MSNEMKDWLADEAQDRESYIESCANALDLTKASSDQRQVERWIAERAKKGYSDYDLWNLDGFFMALIPKALEEFVSKTSSYPGVAPWGTYEEYVTFIKRIIADFREADYLLNVAPTKEDYFEKRQEAQKHLDQAFMNLSKVFNSLWD